MKKLLLLLFMSTLVASAQPREFGDDDAPAGPMHGRGEMIKKLDLTADQNKQFDKFHTDMQKKQIDLRAKVQSLRLDIKNLFSEDLPNKSNIESKINEVSTLQTEMKLNHLRFWFDVNNILKPDQQKIWKSHSLMMGNEGPRKTHEGMGKPMGRHRQWMERGGRSR